MAAAASLIAFAEIWLIVGLVVAALFLAFGLDRLDDSARGAFIFRTLILPGLVLIWPLVVYRWALLETGRDRWRLRHRPPREAHGRVWAVLGALIPIVFLAAMVLNEPPVDGLPPELAPTRLEAPGR